MASSFTPRVVPESWPTLSLPEPRPGARRESSLWRADLDSAAALA
ncbi:MAG: hypothetical protein AAGH83_08080 [Pseudomonadota bacterium]